MMPSAAPFTKSKQISGGCGGTGAAAGLLPPSQFQKCPRCSSPNTKFCYYNNYSLSQPRYFCKTCRRYWTKGGALRNVPVGGAIRKPAKHASKSPSSSSSSRLLPPKSVVGGTANNNINNERPTEFAAGGNYGSIASSIESLSSINQDLHWRLQRERLQGIMCYGAQDHERVSHEAAGTALFLNASSLPATNYQNDGGGICSNGESGGECAGVIRDNWSDILLQFTLLP